MNFKVFKPSSKIYKIPFIIINMMKKIIGYVLAIMGLLGFLLTFDKVKELTNITFLESITNMQMTIAAVVLIAIGVFLIFKSGAEEAPEEVPIYKEDKIIGYRRH